MWSRIFGEGWNIICTGYDYSGAERNENSDEISGAVERNYTLSNVSIHSEATKAVYNSCAGRNKNV